MESVVGVVIATLVGRAVPYTRPGSCSAIAKEAVTGPVRVGREGMDGDEQGDRRVHGGPDKALHLYALEHYADWRRDFAGADAHPPAAALALLGTPGAFGENLGTRGLTESQVCLGDRLRVGSALLEVSQARQPCWKLNDRFGVPDMARRVQQTMRSGWYCRVIEDGTLRAGDAIVLLERPWPAWPLTRLMELLYRRTLDRALLREAQALPLVPSWQRLVARRLAEGTVEDWNGRLDGPR
jgi:MOSC domain-containing protein YiiM